MLQVPRMFQIVDQLSCWQTQTMMVSMERIQKGLDIFLSYLSTNGLNIRGLLVISGFVCHEICLIYIYIYISSTVLENCHLPMGSQKK